MSKWDKTYFKPDMLNDINRNELLGLAESIDSNRIKEYSIKHKIPLSVFDDNGNNLIHKIIENDSNLEIHKLNVIKFLVNNGVSPDSPNSDNTTPLHLACQKQYSKIIKYLLDINSNPNYPDNIGMTPFHYLLSGKITNCPDKKEIKNFFTKSGEKPKKIPEDEMEKATKILYDLIINNNDNHLKSINNLMKNILINSDEIKKYKSTIVEKLTNYKGSNDKTNMLIEIKEIYKPIEDRIKNNALKKFKNFNDIENIKIHQKEKESYPMDGDLSILENSDPKEAIKKEMEKSIESLKKNIENSKYPNVNNFVKFHNSNYDEVEFTNNVRGGVEYTLDDDDKFHDLHQLALNGKCSVVDFENKVMMPLYDKTENIGTFDYKHHLIVNTSILNITEIKRILDDRNKNYNQCIDELLIPLNANNLPETNTNPNLDLVLKDYFKKHFEKLYVDIPFKGLNTDLNDQNNFKATIDWDKWKEIIDLNKKRLDKNDINYKTTWLFNMFSLISRHYSGNKELELQHILLIAAHGNYTTDMKLSIAQAMKIMIIGDSNVQDSIISKNGFGTDPGNNNANDYNGRNLYDIIPAWIYLLLSDDSTENVIDNCTKENFLITNNENLESLIVNIVSYFKNGSINTDKLKWIPSVFRNSENTNSEKIIDGIVTYYDSMEQKPLSQNIADTISIIRYYETLKNTKEIYDNNTNNNVNPDLKKIILKKLVSLGQTKLPLLPPLNTPDMEKLDYKKDFVKKDNIYKTLFGEDKRIENITEYLYPSNSLTIRESEYNKSIGNNHILARLLGLKLLQISPVTENGIAIQFYHYELEKNKPREIPLGNPTIIRQNLNNGNHPEIKSYRSRYMLILYSIIRNIKRMLNKVYNSLYSLVSELPQRGKHFGKVMPIYFPVLNELLSQQDFYLRLIKKQKLEDDKTYDQKNYYTEFFKELYNYKDPFNMSKFTQDINNLNSQYYLYYYFSDKDPIKIPKFFFYQLPAGNKYSNFLQYDFDTEKLLDNDITDNITNLDDSTNITNLGNYNYNNTSCYECVLNKVRNGDSFVATTVIEKGMKRNKNSELPPALEENVYEIYKFGLIKIIMKTLDKITDINDFSKLNPELKYINIDNKNKEISSKFNLAKKIETIVQGIAKHELNVTISKNIENIFKLAKEVTPITDFKKMLNITPPKFSINFTNIKILNNYANTFDTTDDKQKKFLFNFYNISKKPDELNRFFLYPNDYTNLYLMNKFSCLCIKEESIENFLNNYGKPFMIDNQKCTPIHYLLKNYYAKGLEKLESNKVDIKFCDNNNKIILNSPLDYFINEYKNHIDKFNGGNDTDYYKCFKNNSNNNKYKLKHFIMNQYEEIKDMILANENFGNNIIRNLDTSFIMAQYLTQEYLTEYFIKYDNKFDDYDKKLEFNDSNNFFIKYLKDNQISENDKNLFLEDIKTDLKEKQKLLKEREEKLDKVNPKPTTIINEINGNISKIKTTLSKLGSPTMVKLSITVNTYVEIIKNYSELLNKDFDKNHGAYMSAWNNFLKEDKDNILPKFIINKENELLKKISENKTIEKDEIEKLNKPYEVWSEISKEYFENEKYLTDNETIKFAFDMLKHLTKNIICYNIELMMRKVIFSHIQINYPENELNDYISIIDYILGRNYLYESNTHVGATKSEKKLLSILYEDLSEKFVKNAVDYFYNDQDDKVSQVTNSETTSEILTSFFELLSISEVYSIPKNSQAMNILINDVTSYFDTFINKLIENWLIVFENQMRFVINQERILDCLSKMLE
jgi:hypothetical protein